MAQDENSKGKGGTEVVRVCLSLNEAQSLCAAAEIVHQLATNGALVSPSDLLWASDALMTITEPIVDTLAKYYRR